jgi:lipopolysaccharide/colanic/teichoic acid biosynthesis glycosyltransferase
MSSGIPATRWPDVRDRGSTQPRWTSDSQVPAVGQHVLPLETVERPAPAADAELERLAAQLLARRPTRYERFVKPVIDRVGSAVLLLLLAPVLLLAALTLLAAVGRPVLIRQTRAGRGREPFNMVKFRTMLPDRRVGAVGYDGPERRRTHKTADDPRHTHVGRLMRKLSLDELPQLFNVLRGDMSLVGPRPELYENANGFCEWQHTRHVVKPGLTGIWQTTARGQGRLLHECVDLDLRYIEQLSLRQDLAILGRTPLALLRTRGVI